MDADFDMCFGVSQVLIVVACSGLMIDWYWIYSHALCATAYVSCFHAVL